MGKKKNNQVGKVISVRITDDEKEALRKVMSDTRKSASNVMREAIRLFLATSS